MAQHYDGNISVPGCDKNSALIVVLPTSPLTGPPAVPGCLIAAARHNRPTIIVYGGTIQAGTRHVDCPAMGFKKGDPVNIGQAFEAFGAISLAGSGAVSLRRASQAHTRRARSRTKNGST